MANPTSPLSLSDYDLSKMRPFDGTVLKQESCPFSVQQISEFVGVY